MVVFVVSVFPKKGQKIRNISLKIQRDFQYFNAAKVRNTYRGPRSRSVGYGFVKYGKNREEILKWIMENYGKYELSVIEGEYYVKEKQTPE